MPRFSGWHWEIKCMTDGREIERRQAVAGVEDPAQTLKDLLVGLEDG